MFCIACGRPHVGECDKMVLLKNELDYQRQTGSKSGVAALEWATAEIERRLQAALAAQKGDGPITTEALDVVQFGRQLHSRPAQKGEGEREKLSENQTRELFADIEEALQWWEIKGPRDSNGNRNRDWRGIAGYVQEAMARSECCTISNPFVEDGRVTPTYCPAPSPATWNEAVEACVTAVKRLRHSNNFDIIQNAIAAIRALTRPDHAPEECALANELARKQTHG